MTSRAQNLLVLVGDSSVLHESVVINAYLKSCRNGAPGSSIEFAPVQMNRQSAESQVDNRQ